MRNCVGGCKGECICELHKTDAGLFLAYLSDIPVAGYAPSYPYRVYMMHMCICICILEINIHAYIYKHTDMCSCACLCMHTCSISRTQARLKMKTS